MIEPVPSATTSRPGSAADTSELSKRVSFYVAPPWRALPRTVVNRGSAAGAGTANESVMTGRT